VVSLRGADEQATQAGVRERPILIVLQLMGSVNEQALLFSDGWISVVRVEPYRVVWRRPDGSIVTGPELPWESPRADATERRAYADRHKRRFGDSSPVPEVPWADRIAPIRPGSVGTPEGNILIARSLWSRVTDNRYDLVNRTGRLVGRLVLADTERVVGFGPRHIYIAVTDGNEFQRLRRHPWP
jgi:hypothetical protein